MKFANTIRTALLCTAAAAVFAAPAIGSKARILGTSGARTSASAAATTGAPVVIGPFKTYQRANYGTGGVALRNRSTGAIHISGVTGVAQAAWIYWAYLFTDTPPARQKITITRLFPAGPTATVAGTLVATGGDPCWGSAGNAVYRAAVPTALANGNGLYQVVLDKGASALATGEDPWDGNVVFPAAEGASMVIVGEGTSNVSVYDKGLSGTEFGPALSYQLKLPLAMTGSSVLLDAFGADGQGGPSRLQNPLTSGETVNVNGTIISGPGGVDSDSDWNGSSGFPLPTLWDDTGHDITAQVKAGSTRVNVTITPGDDCLVTVANVLAY